MRVAFCVPGYGPEVEQLQPWLTVHEVASSLIASDWEVHLITDVNKPSALEGMQYHYVSSMRPSNAAGMREVINAIKPDRMVVLVTPLSLSVSGWYKYIECKVLAFLSYPFYTRRELLRALPHLDRDDLVAFGRHALVPKFLWIRTLRKYFDGVIAQSNRTVHRVADAVGPDIGAYPLCAGLDLDFWQPRADIDKACEGNTVRFLYIGSAKAIRGFEVLLDAFKCLQGHEVQLRILARGSTPDEVSALKQTIAARTGSMREHIEIIGGWMEKKRYRDELRSADVVVLPFVLVPSELPVSVMECIACGTPVIATDIDGLPDAVGRAGMVVRSGSVSSLVKAMNELVSGQKRLAQMEECCNEVRARMMRWTDVGIEWKRMLSE